MCSWPLHDAKARYNELLYARLSKRPLKVTPRGNDVTELLPEGAWCRMQSAARTSHKLLLMCDQARGEWGSPARAYAKRRSPQVQG